MKSNLIIVESPSKATTIKKFLGSKSKVIATKGHIRDLPKSRLGIDESNFEAEYINVRGKAPLIKELKQEAAQADNVFLASDPDREGEAISWHLANILGINEDVPCRVTFNEITKEAVTNAVKNPRKIDINLVDAQQTRRMLDRLVGYKISPILWKTIKSGLSAGRVQSVALKIIVDREKEIQSFEKSEYWTLNVSLKKDGFKEKIIAKFYGKDKKAITIENQDQLNKIKSVIEKGQFIVDEVKYSSKKQNPSPPFTTSTMGQSASRLLGFNLKKTMQVAQSLYEGVTIPGKRKTGLITYMRTDSVRISSQAQAAAKEEILKMFGSDYYQSRNFKVKAQAQDGHEAIRPSYIQINPESIKDYLSADQYKLYNLIYKRFLASQMAPAVYNNVTIKTVNSGYEFRTVGSQLDFEGFLKIYNIQKETEKENEEEGLEQQDQIFKNLPKLEKGDILNMEKIESKQNFTKPPSRYTEASLVKKMEENGIGRPSTYAPTINTIIERQYIKKEKKTLVPTELGMKTNDLLQEFFANIFNIEFTANIEEKLDKIADGDLQYKAVLENFYKELKQELDKANTVDKKVQITPEYSDIDCQECGSKMVYKYGRFGKFLACSNFPQCKNTMKIQNFIDAKCPKCGGKIAKRKSKYKYYYICENNPKNGCDYISWDIPKETK